MKLKVLGSSSAGNCYILESDTEALIIEAGLPFMEVKKALNFNVRKIVEWLPDIPIKTIAFLSTSTKVFALYTSHTR